MKTVDSARELARRMVDIGNNAGRKTFAVITDMNDPLGTAVGNALEVIEAVEALKGKGDEKLMEVVYTLASYMVFGAGKAASVEEARKMLEETITSGKALERFAQFVKAQGGDDAVVYDTSLFKLGSIVTDVPALEDGFVSGIRADEVGIASLILGAGREKKEDVIDPGVGIIVKKKTGDAVKKGETIATLYANDPSKVKAATERLYGAYTFSKSHVDAPKMIYDIVE